MDELLIEEKKYISSKRAAQVTGYAKDYIGQLCREGRLPARLVGRNWYVLETAINDHRFGNREIKPEIRAEPPASIFSPTWESPHYEASSTEALPAIHRSGDTEEEPFNDQKGSEVSQHLQDSWKAWFERIADAASVIPAVPEEPKEEIQTGLEIDREEPETEEIEEDANVPIRAMYRRPPKELLPAGHNFAEADEDGAQEPQMQEGRSKSTRMKTIHMAGAVIAVLTATLAVINTGYFDRYIVSSSQASAISGVLIYNK